jgi:hypothetical protein
MANFHPNLTHLDHTTYQANKPSIGGYARLSGLDSE